MTAAPNPEVVIARGGITFWVCGEAGAVGFELIALLVPQATPSINRPPVRANVATSWKFNAKLRGEREKQGDAPCNTNGLTSMRSVADLWTGACVHLAK